MLRQLSSALLGRCPILSVVHECRSNPALPALVTAAPVDVRNLRFVSQGSQINLPPLHQMTSALPGPEVQL